MRIEEWIKLKENLLENNNVKKKDDPVAIVEEVKTYIRMVISGIQNCLILTGRPGIGKTTMIIKELEEAKLKIDKDYVKVTGVTTPFGVYLTLMKHSKKIIIFDDSDRAIEESDSLTLLNSALDTQRDRIVSWTSKTSLHIPKDGKIKIPDKFKFEGRIIISSNLSMKFLSAALFDRSMINEIVFTKEAMIEYLRLELKNVIPGVSFGIKLKALQLLRHVSEQKKNIEISFRTLEKAIKIYQTVLDSEKAEEMIATQCSFK
jgi:hypothetical protein